MLCPEYRTLAVKILTVARQTDGRVSLSLPMEQAEGAAQYKTTQDEQLLGLIVQ
jgi:hypothetical protein